MTIRKSLVESFRKQLETRREMIAADLRAATAEMINADEAYPDTIDQAAADVDRGLMQQMKNRERDTLWQIDEALKRIEAGNYGACESCEEEIAAARLKAFPFATVCVDCKTEMESEERRVRRAV